MENAETLHRYEGQVAVVTGAGGGIGRATAMRLAREGAHVVLFDRDGEALDAGIAALGALGLSGEAKVGDVASAADVARVFAEIHAGHRQVHLLANVAGISAATKRMVEDVPDDDIERIFGVNLIGLYRCIQQVAPGMKRHGYGRIVNVASIGAIHATTPGNTAYAMSKGGVASLTRQLVLELAAHNVTTNAIAPGFIRTALLEQRARGKLEVLTGCIPAGRLGTPDDIAAAVAFLGSAEAGFINGQMLVADGGMSTVTMVPPVN